MISTHKDESIKRLLIKISHHIGHSAAKYISRFLSSKKQFSSIELEIIERVFTMGFYSDEVIEIACSIALEAQVFNVVDFNIMVCEVDNG